MPEKKKPDLVVYNEETGTYDAALRPYATSASAPKITTDDLTTWKNNYVKAFNHRTQARFDAIKQEYQSLLEEIQENNRILEAEFNFEPNIGSIYHLYSRENKKPFLSLIEPKQCKFQHLGSYVLNHERIWQKHRDDE